MATTAQETDQITAAVQLYIDGAREGDADKLRAAFHSDARMGGSLAGQRSDGPISAMIEMLDGKPVDVDGSYVATITSCEQTDDTAEVAIAEQGFWGTVSFVDFFSLARIGDEWKIVNKTFVHTGGELPAA